MQGTYGQCWNTYSKKQLRDLMYSDLRSRVIYYCIAVLMLAPLLVGNISNGSVPQLSNFSLFAILSIVLVVSVYELFCMVNQNTIDLCFFLACGLGLVLLSASFAISLHWIWLKVAAAISAFAFATTYIALSLIASTKGITRKIMFISTTQVYLSFPLVCLGALGYVAGPFFCSNWLVFLIVIVKSGDTAGYFIGRSVKGPLLSKRLSPKKTISGSIASVIASASFSLLFSNSYICCLTTPLIHNWMFGVMLAILLNVLGQCGDLFESAIKRDVGLKDSSAFSKAGGVLDSIDSLLFAAPILIVITRFL